MESAGLVDGRYPVEYWPFRCDKAAVDSMLKEKDDLSWYARKAAQYSNSRLGESGTDGSRSARIQELLARLKDAGIRGDFKSKTLFTRRLPPGCKGCLKGLGTNLYVTGLCTRNCFFCFNQKPRRDEIVVHGIPVQRPEQAAEIIRRFGLKSVGISGGEPLLFPNRVLAIIQCLRSEFEDLRIDLYTNGDPLTDELAADLKDEGLDGLRFNLVAREFDLTPVRRALGVIDEVAVEVPVIPEQQPRLKRMILDLDRMGVSYLNIHELFLCGENERTIQAQGHKAPASGEYGHLMWRPTEASGECALELLLFAAKNTSRLSVYYCSCGTQEMISRRGLAQRKKRTFNETFIDSSPPALG